MSSAVATKPKVLATRDLYEHQTRFVMIFSQMTAARFPFFCDPVCWPPSRVLAVWCMKDSSGFDMEADQVCIALDISA